MVAHTQGDFLVQADFASEAQLPTKYTCNFKGDAVPEIRWSGTPEGTKSFVLIADDPDAPGAEPYVHWVVFNIPAEAKKPENGKNGITSGNALGYTPACPPPGKPHHYNFTVYALDVVLDLPEGCTKRDVTRAMRNHILAQDTVVGIYSAQKQATKKKSKK